MHFRFILALLALVASLCVGAKERTNIIFETDMGNDVDDALAIDMLYKWHREGRIRLMAVMLNKEGLAPVQFIDLLNTWYGCRRIPIGTTSRREQSRVAGKNYTQVVCEEKDAKGRPLYKRSIKDYASLPTAVALHRRLLAAAADQSVTIVSVGFSTNLAELLASTPDEFSPLGGRELVAQKVARLVVMAGHMRDPKYKEYNVVNDIPACQKVYNQWPTDIVTSPFELGLQIRYPASSIENDFGWTEHHPIVDAYKAYLPKMEDRPTWDLTAALYAVDPQQFFNISPAGRIDVTDEGCTHFTEDANGRHYYIYVTPQQATAIKRYFVETITRKP